jgi:hypothetical protein
VVSLGARGFVRVRGHFVNISLRGVQHRAGRLAGAGDPPPTCWCPIYGRAKAMRVLRARLLKAGQDRPGGPPRGNHCWLGGLIRVAVASLLEEEG